MQTRMGWLALLLSAGMALAPTAVQAQQLVPTTLTAPTESAAKEAPPPALAPSVVRAQMLDYEVPRADPVFPLPLYSPRPDLGGFFFTGEFIYWRQTNPLRNQIIAVRGFVDTDGASPGAGVGVFVGDGFEALNAEDVAGPGTYVPGYRFSLGYRFRNGVVVEGIYTHMFNVRYVAAAGLLPPLSQLDDDLANTFLFSPVFNFSLDWAGPDLPDIAGGNPLGNFGIWNAADEMTLRFEQRLEKWDLRFRIPIFETEYDPVHNPNQLAWRTYGLAGIRHYWLVEVFKWRTVDRDVNGNATPADVANYSNLISQPMYGPFVGWGGEIYRGHGFSLSLDLIAGAYVNFVREIVRWEREGGGTAGLQEIAAKRSRRVYTIVPETEAHLNWWWYPIEGIQIRLGYDVMALYNTIASPRPVDFDFGAMAPDFPHKAVRLIDGFNLGIGFLF